MSGPFGPRGGTSSWGQYKTPDMAESIRAQQAFSSICNKLILCYKSSKPQLIGVFYKRKILLFRRDQDLINIASRTGDFLLTIAHTKFTSAYYSLKSAFY